MTKKQLESSDNTRDLLTKKLTELTEKLDSSNFQLSELYKERDNLQKNLENMRSDKQVLERGRTDLSNLVWLIIRYAMQV